MLPNKIILSCNDNETYRDFWPIVAWAYRKMFPDVSIHLAFLTNRSEDDPLVVEFKRFGEVTLFRPLQDVPEAGQAKMLRFILASEMASLVCYIDDIDLIPLRADFITSKLKKRPEGVLLCVGGEVYGLNGCYPVSQMTAEGYVWKKMINPKNLGWQELIRTWKDQAKFDSRENINIWEPDMTRDFYFSDERLLRRLYFENPVPKIEIQRGYDDYLMSTIDRHTLNEKTDVWEYDKEKLKAGKFVNAHCVRPYTKYAEQFIPIRQYIIDNYEQR